MFGSLIDALDGANSRVCNAQRQLLSLIAEVERTEAWQGSGARNLAHWLSMRYGISHWKAGRWVGAARALEGLPRLSEVFSGGRLGMDKVVELARFATPETEARLIRWAEEVSCATVRRKGDLAVRASIEEVVEAEDARSLSWWHTDEGRRIGLLAELPAAQGAIVVRAIERMADQVPQMPDERGDWSSPARHADALVAICSARIAADPDTDRATVVVHAQADAAGRVGAGEIDGGPVIHAQGVQRLLCDARIQTVLEDRDGDVVGLGRMAREPSQWMVRQIRHRDRGCRFPGCGTRAFTQAHHIRWWSRGGRTDLDSLLLICSFHHRLVHEHAWSVERDRDGAVTWRRPGGSLYRAGPRSGTDADDEIPLADTG